ncbi:MAG: V-type ATP synthase subunit E, partial [Clostridiales bacterium]|nr:V-type ATP synthase subunit E [Clostridiales bacterium]
AANDILKKRGMQPALTVSEDTGSFTGGLIVRQGDIEVNCSVSKLIELSRDSLAGPIAEILFSD